jgi:hypothetical protein
LFLINSFLSITQVDSLTNLKVVELNDIISQLKGSLLARDVEIRTLRGNLDDTTSRMNALKTSNDSLQEKLFQKTLEHEGSLKVIEVMKSTNGILKATVQSSTERVKELESNVMMLQNSTSRSSNTESLLESKERSLKELTVKVHEMESKLSSQRDDQRLLSSQLESSVSVIRGQEADLLSTKTELDLSMNLLKLSLLTLSTAEIQPRETHLSSLREALEKVESTSIVNECLGEDGKHKETLLLLSSSSESQQPASTKPRGLLTNWKYWFFMSLFMILFMYW